MLLVICQLSHDVIGYEDSSTAGLKKVTSGSPGQVDFLARQVQ